MPPDHPPALPGLELSSPHNPRIKALAKLMADSSERRLTGTFVLEGLREISRALAHGFAPREAYGVPELYEKSPNDIRKIHSQLAEAGVNPHTITKQLFSKVALRESRDGMLVVFQQKALHQADRLITASKSGKPFLLALQGVEKPGNIGALLRCADGAAVDGVLVIQDHKSPSFDRYHPQTLRNSLGAAFSLDFAVITPGELPVLCHQHQLLLVAAALSPEAVNLYQTPLHSPLVLMLGSEAQGLDRNLIARADKTIQIPMGGICDSLNVAAAGAVILYEIVRQREAFETSSR